MNKKRTPAALPWIAGILFLQACTLDEPAPGSVGNTLTLTANQNLSLTSLNWNPVKVTGFKEYVILQSTEEIPYSPTPEISATVSVLKRIDDADITSFTASDILFSPRICYKLYASVDDRFIQSSDVCVDSQYELLEGFYDRGGHLNGLDEMVLFDRVDKHLISYNYKEGTITNTVSDFFLSFPILEMNTWLGTTNVFAYDQSPARLRIYRFPGLTSTVFKDFHSVLFAANFYNQFIFIAVEEFGSAFKVLNGDNLAVIDNEQGTLGNRNIAVFPGDPVIVLEISDFNINRYAIDADGKATFLGTQTPGVTQLSTQNATARGNNLFITGRLGSMVDREGNIVGTLNSNFNSTVFITRFSQDENKVAYIVTDNITVRLEVADISNPAHIVVLASYNVPSANYADLLIEDDIIYTIGLSFATGIAQTFVLKYPMP